MMPEYELENTLGATVPDVGWQARLTPAVCEQCDWRFMLPAGSPPQRCPHCFRQSLTELPSDTELQELAYTPELVLPFAVAETEVAQAVEQFARSFPYPPRDLTPANLRQRLRRVYLPQWLVDASVQARFQLEVGFDYDVVSHRERYINKSWQTEEVRETRIRWELRVGELEREYQNVPAPALEAGAGLLKQLGAYDRTGAEPYAPQHLNQSFVHLPDRSPGDAWPAAVTGFQSAAADECRRAASAQHSRDFQWTAEFAQQHWTQLLRPLFTTYYLDDEDRPQAVLVHGQTGRLHGERRSSMRRARRLALILGGAGFLFVLLALLLVGLSVASLGALTPFAILAALVAVGFLLAALVPPLRAYSFNRRSPG